MLGGGGGPGNISKPVVKAMVKDDLNRIRLIRELS
jgi:hypothetical protein